MFHPCYFLVNFKQKPKVDNFQQFLGRNDVLVSVRKQYIFIYTHTHNILEPYWDTFLIGPRDCEVFTPFLNAQLTAQKEDFLKAFSYASSSPHLSQCQATKFTLIYLFCPGGCSLHWALFFLAVVWTCRVSGMWRTLIFVTALGQSLQTGSK